MDNSATGVRSSATTASIRSRQPSALFALDSFSGVENLTYTGTGDFTGSGNELDNVITGGSGSDTLDGGGGNDTLDGGAAPTP